MSHSKGRQHNYEFVDADDEIVISRDNAAILDQVGSTSDAQFTLPSGEVIDSKNTLQSFVETHREPLDNDSNEIILSRESTTEANNAEIDGDPQFCLPTRHVIDSKNTLHSFVDTSRTPEATSAAVLLSTLVHDTPVQSVDHRPMLMNGDVIDSKNTLQSFDKISEHTEHPAPIVPSEDLLSMDGNRRDEPNHDVSPTLMNATASTSVSMASATEPNVVFAELAPELLPSVNVALITDDDSLPPRPWYKNISKFLLLAFIAVLAAIGLGVYFGFSGRNDLSGQGANSSPTNSPIAVLSSAPTVSMPSLNPSISQDTLNMRAEVLTSYINNITLLNQTIAINGTSPESLALSWMITNDTALDTIELTNVNEISSSSIGFKVRQRFPLLVMWFQQTETEVWAITDGWLVDPDECNWYGIACEIIYVMYDSFNGGSHNVTTQITFNVIRSYVGAIPVDICLLSNLKHLEIRNTREPGAQDMRYLEGTLPETIGQLTALTYFNVNFNYLSGTLPNIIGQWTALTYFDVGNNDLTSSLPDSIGLWAALTYFDISHNDWTGSLPSSIGQWVALRDFGARFNFRLSGSLPDTIGQSMAMSSFDISYTNLTGTFPSSIGQWTLLTFFDVSNNLYLHGTIPDSVGQWTSLRYFDVSDNSGLNGTLPDSLGQWTALKFFSCGNNDLTGILPSSIGQWTALTSFSVTGNDLNGTIPASIGNWSLIAGAYFDSNAFVGSVPAVICQYIEQGVDFLVADCDLNCTCCTGQCE
jgi:hypothetical protein